MRGVLEYNTSHNFNQIIMEIEFIGYYKQGKEESEQFVMNAFCQLFDLEELSLKDFTTKVMYWMYNTKTTRVGVASWK